jgi:hypothetical protein
MGSQERRAEKCLYSCYQLAGNNWEERVSNLGFGCKYRIPTNYNETLCLVKPCIFLQYQPQNGEEKRDLK